MEVLNLWETNIADKFTFLYDIESLINLIVEKGIDRIHQREKFIPGDSIESPLENNISKQNLGLVYTNQQNPIVYKEFVGLYINSEFLEKHKEQIKEALINNINKNNFCITLTPFTYSKEYMKKLIKEKPYCKFLLIDIDLTEEDIVFFNDNIVEVTLVKNNEKKIVSDNLIIGSVYKELAIRATSTMRINIEQIDVINPERLKIINDKTEIYIDCIEYPTIEQYKKLEEFLIALDSIGKTNIIKFVIKNRENFKTSNLLNVQFQNIKFVVTNDLYDYPIEQYIKEEEKLDSMVAHIKNANLSPLEKYIAVYNLVKNFKKYKENNEDKDQSRYLRFILDNEYIVCVGYAKLLETLCQKVGISCEEISVSVDTSYDKGFTEEEIAVEVGGHARNLVRIDDDKYGIHGIYMADPTWDNDLENDYLNFALTTIDKTQQTRRMFWSNNMFLILDVHNFQEFNDQVNFMLKNEYEVQIKYLEEKLKTSNNGKLTTDIKLANKEKYDQALLSAYRSVVFSIKSTLKVDKTNFDQIYNKYKFNNEKDYIDFLTEIGNYIVSVSNKKFDQTIIIDANVASKNELGMPISDNISREDMIKQHFIDDIVRYPYAPSQENPHKTQHITDKEYIKNLEELPIEMQETFLKKVKEIQERKEQEQLKENEKVGEGKSL